MCENARDLFNGQYYSIRASGVGMSAGDFEMVRWREDLGGDEKEFQVYEESEGGCVCGA